MFYSILKILCFFSSFLLCSSVVDESVAFNVDNGASHVDLLMENCVNCEILQVSIESVTQLCFLILPHLNMEETLSDRY